MPPSFRRLAYVCEFLLALIAITVLWGQVGGQDHLDLMPWYDKFVLIVSLALVTVLGTVASVSHQRAWNRTTVVCLVVALAIACAMGAVTYYYHLHEDDEDQDSTDGSVAVMVTNIPAGRCT
jgi:heme/copper-type cytochrome/quinol oxidase subunit 4